MSCCSIYNRSFLMDVDFNSASIDITKIKNLIPTYESSKSGLWFPLVIKLNQSNIEYGEPLIKPRTDIGNAFDPCNCNSDSIYDYNVLEENQNFACDYCSEMTPTNFSKVWRLKDTDGNESTQSFTATCCSGACDTRMHSDDYLPKIPVLNQQYLDKFYDFKYLEQFPAVTNPGLGFKNFITFSNLNSQSFDSSYPQLVIDWNIKERISEIPYDIATTQHDNEEDHNKSYKKSLQCSDTCGNFILTQINPKYSGINPYYPIFSGLIGDPDQSLVPKAITGLLPSTTGFTSPYGFSKNTYNNIFVKTEKLGSHWKWNYTSGILGWYRYFDKDRKEDKRPIAGIDLYISPGDVFYATNQGPEPIPTANPEDMENVAIKNCPSGLKLIKNNSITGVIPAESKFTYISTNLYDKVFSLYNRLSVADTGSTMNKIQKFELAALLSTAPQYDTITVDLLKRNYKFDYLINDYMQLSGMNKDMMTSKIGSINNLNFITNKSGLIYTLANKYGSYLWFPPNQTTTLTLSKNIYDQCFVDLSFDMVVKSADTKNLGSCSITKDCSANSPSKQFSYSQKISCGSNTIYSKVDTRTRYNTVCNTETQTIDPDKSARMAGIYINNNLVKETVYYSGCSMFKDTYPRIIDKDTTNFCNECGPDTSYGLVIPYHEELCRDNQGTADNFCDYTQARFHNNSQLHGTVGTRASRSILDGTNYFERKYNATAFNSRIDKVAFHHQGGFYYDSKPFGVNGITIFMDNNSFSSGKIKIVFDTKDIGIKLYQLNAQKLRGANSETHNCIAFPNSNPCECHGLNIVSDFPQVCNASYPIKFTNQPLLYTPSLSTTYSPKLKAYGGYSSGYISGLFGDKTIPNHPSVGTLLSTVNKKIDPLNPYGCAQNISLNLPNYVKTSWSFTLPSYKSDHADIWAEILEDVDLFHALDCTENYNDDRFGCRPNAGYQRFANSVSINNINLYDKQKKIFISKGGGSASSVSLEIVNPYLKALLGGEYVLYPPIGTFCNNKTIFGGRGDESTSVPIQFSYIPRKQMLNFVTKEQNPMGYLKRGFFHPNSGITYNADYQNSTPFKYDHNFYMQINDLTKTPATSSFNSTKDNISQTNGMYCEYSQVNRSSSDLSRFDSGIVLIGTITKQLKQVLNQINSIDSHKKPRLHLKINDKWYEYKIPNTMGFIKNEQKYIGEPFLFEYVQSEDKAKVSNIMIPIPPKEHIKFNWLYNSPSFKNSENDIDSTTYKKPLIYNDEYYPAAPVKFIKKTKKIIRIPGARAYFYIPEFDNGIQSQATDIKNITLKEQETISSFRTDILLKNGERLRYKGEGSKTDIKSYVYTDYNYLYSNFSNSHIDYTKVSKNGYVFNTHKSCNSSILLADKEYKEYIDPNAKIHTQENKILEKKLYAIYLDNNGNEVDKDYLGHKYLNIYTEFLLEDNIKTTYDYKYIELFNINNIMSLIIYQNIDVLKKEKDLKLYNPLYSSKWSDLINFDQQLEYEITKYHDLYQNYPKSLYKNIFDKFIISNYQPERLNFKLTNSYGNSNLFFILSNNTDEYPLSACIPIYYYIHQKYDVGLNINDGMTTEKTQNYLPFLDVSFPVINKNTNGSKKDITSIAKYNSGTVIFSGIYQNHDSDYDWGAAKNPNKEDLFWINLNISYPLESSLTLKPGEAFYSNTFRIDDTPFKLYSVSSNMGNISSSACLKTFYPTIPSSTTNFDSKVLDFSHYQYSGIDTKPFARFPIYCDTDQLGSCESLKCGMDVIGSLAFSGTYNLYKESSVSINDANADNIPYIISYDGGVYNPLGNSGLQYIQRSELPPNNTLFPTFACDSNVQPRPNLNRYSVLNEEYQSIMSENIVDDHSALVKNTDILANEMLFRILYGEQQKINLKSIDGIDNTISLNDLLKYSDPKIEAKDVYKNIPYDLDIYADSKDREINGSISINGKLAVGKNVSISIENKNISISVVRESGKILARCDVDGYTFDGTIYTEYTDNHNLMVTTGPASAADPTTSYNLLARCKELQQSSFSLSRFVTSTTINVEGGEAVSFPYWPEPLTGYEVGFGQPPAWASENHPSLALEFRPPCLPAPGGPVVYQTNRGVDPNYADKLPSNCFVFANYSASVNLGTYARGTFPDCHPDGSTNFGSWNEGNAENAVGGAIIAQPLAAGHGITTTSPPCGSCNTLSYTNPLTGNNEYSVFSMGFYPPSPGYASNSCECADWGYGYCRNTNNASACICSDLRYDYSEFDYNFEYCRYNITLKGHKRKLNYPQNANTTTISSPCGSTEEGTHITAGSNGSGQQSEDCAWIECLGSPPATYHIYDVVTRANNDLYKPLCPTSLCTITYDNNSITINLVGADSQCITNSIRNSCPKLSVTVPDDSFTVSDQITSLCNGCDVEPNKINMIEQKQNWDIITETRTCVLDYLLTGGNPNENGPVGINAQTFPCGTCGDPAHCRGCKDEEGAGGIGQCGKNAPDSFPWSVCITYGDGEGIVCRNGNGVGESRSGFPVVGGCDIPVSFPYSNSQAGERIQEYWKSQMRQRWLNTVPCNNHYVPSYNVNDIVEGVVPGSCSDIKYTTVSYPAIKYRATLSDPVVSRSAISYTVAYYTYRYRRPRTVQDILKGDDTVNKCNSVTASCPSNIFNITETYKTAGCDTIPHCYDTNTSSCDDNNYCCRTQRTKYV